MLMTDAVCERSDPGIPFARRPATRMAEKPIAASVTAQESCDDSLESLYLFLIPV